MSEEIFSRWQDPTIEKLQQENQQLKEEIKQGDELIKHWIKEAEELNDKEFILEEQLRFSNKERDKLESVLDEIREYCMKGYPHIENASHDILQILDKVK